MEQQPSSRRREVWSLIGYLSFGIFGILLGAALVYALFTFFLVPPLQEDSGTETANDLPSVEPDLIPGVIIDLADVVDTVMPAVVGVNKHVYITRFGEQRLEEVESGSGAIISADGYIVTNHHVVEGADRITVLIPDVGRYDAEIIGMDLLTDLALLQIEESGLYYIPLGDSSQIRVGETVVAIGNPLGYFQQTVTAGIISATGRQVRVPGSEYAYTFVQTDALVNPGNSGGPLVNLQGELIGINTAKIALAGVEGIGLSIPSNTVIRIIDDLLLHGRVLRPHLGVVIEDWLDYSDEGPERGVRIIEIAPGSAADQAGLIPGDIIVRIGSHDIHYLARLFDSLLDYYPGDSVVVAYFRDGEEFEVEVVLGERPETIAVEEPELFDPEESVPAEPDPESLVE
jgi:serine protease Do